MTTSATINGKTRLPFVIDSGASAVTIPANVFRDLVTAGVVSAGDLRRSSVFRFGDGSTKVRPTFLIRSLRVGDVTVENLVGSVAEEGAPLLIGQTFLRRFKSWSIDNSRQVLVLR